MSFVNDVLAEEADRKDLILFEDSSVFRDADFSPIHDSARLKKKYWLNFLLALIVLTIAINFIDQLPVSKSYSNTSNNTKYSYTEKLDLPILKPTFIQETVENETIVVVEEKSDPEEKHFVQEVSAEKILEKPKPQLQQPIQKSSRALVKSDQKVEQVLDLTSDKIVFNKNVSTDQTQIKIETQFEHAQQLIQQGEVASAITELKQVLILDDRHLEVRLLLTAKLIDQGRAPEAIKVYKKGLLITPGESRLAKPLAHLLVERGKIDQSLQVLQQAAPSTKTDPDYHSFIASLQQQTGRHGKAITIYQQILKSQPENGKWWLGLGISLMAEARNKEALIAFESSLHDERISSALKQFASQRILDLKDSRSENRGNS